MNYFSRLFLLASLILVTSAPMFAFAEYIEPGTVKVQTVSYQPDSSNLNPGIYFYNITWQGLAVAKAEVEVYPVISPDQPQKVVARTRTSGLVSAFYNMKHHSESMFQQDSFRPIHFSSNQKERRKHKFREVSFKENGDIRSVRWRKGKGKIIQEFDPNNVVYDPISAAFLAKSLKLEVGKKMSFDVFNGKHRYLIDFSVEEKAPIKVNRKKIEAYKVVPSVKKLTDSLGEQKLTSSALWITADEKRDILKVSSKVWIGSVVAKFDKFVANPTKLLEAKSDSRLTPANKSDMRAQIKRPK